jgi:hypothetical protein
MNCPPLTAPPSEGSPRDGSPVSEGLLFENREFSLRRYISSSSRDLSVSASIASLRFSVPSFNCRITAEHAHEAVLRNLGGCDLAKPFGLMRGENHLQATPKPPSASACEGVATYKPPPQTPIQAAWPDAVSLTTVRYRFRHKPAGLTLNTPPRDRIPG